MKTVICRVFLLATLLVLQAHADVTLTQGRLVLDEPIRFVAGTADLDVSSEPSLQAVKTFLESKTYISRLRVEGHLAAGGVESLAQRLSEARALAVADWLVAHGIDCHRLLPVGFGVTKPVVDNDGPERALNSRIELVPAELRGHAIGSMPLDGGGQPAAGFCPMTSN